MHNMGEYCENKETSFGLTVKSFNNPSTCAQKLLPIFRLDRLVTAPPLVTPLSSSLSCNLTTSAANTSFSLLTCCNCRSSCLQSNTDNTTMTPADIRPKNYCHDNQDAAKTRLNRPGCWKHHKWNHSYTD